jgi:hypothetical protein
MLYKERKKGEQSVTTTTTKKGESYLCVEGVGSRGEIFCVRALLVLPRFLHSNRAHMEMKMMLEFWRQNAEAKMFPFPTKTPLSLRTRI